MMMKLFEKIMMSMRMKSVLFFFLSCMVLSNCVEPFDFETEDFESILVINATITNELKNQQLVLSRTYRFEEDGPLKEQNAEVKILDDHDNEYLFNETSPGIYTSIEAFNAELGKEYRLSIKTENGKSYISAVATLPQESAIDNLYPKRMFNDDDLEGVGILIDSFDPTGNSVYYRYEYEETYRIVASLWVPRDLRDVLIGNETLMIETIEYTPRPIEERVCYNTRVSNEIIITNTTTFTEDRVTEFPVKFINAEDISVADRYSILVRQYVQSREANQFYETLNRFSQSESFFSQVQSGFIAGNIISESNTGENVLGFFDVSSVSSKRIFFDRSDLISDLPQFSPGCDRIIPVLREEETIENYNIRLLGFIQAEEFRFFEEYRNSNPIDGFFAFVRRGCGDCTEFGQSIVPDFWID